jgi:hypothetical protein
MNAKKILEIDGGDKANLDECHELLDLIHVDGTIHDLDQYPEDRPQTTLGRTLCWLLHQYDRQREALIVAASECDVMGDVAIPVLASEIAAMDGRGENPPADRDYIEAYIQATERLK